MHDIFIAEHFLPPFPYRICTCTRTTAWQLAQHSTAPPDAFPASLDGGNTPAAHHNSNGNSNQGGVITNSSGDSNGNHNGKDGDGSNGGSGSSTTSTDVSGDEQQRQQR